MSSTTSNTVTLANVIDELRRRSSRFASEIEEQGRLDDILTEAILREQRDEAYTTRYWSAWFDDKVSEQQDITDDELLAIVWTALTEE